VSRHGKHGIFSHWRSIISGMVTCVSCWSIVQSAAAQKTESPSLVAFLSVSTVPMESIRNNINEQIDRNTLPERDRQRILMTHHKPTDTKAWEKFESEFRPAQESPSPVNREIEIAKYGLDTATFAVDHFLKSIVDHADFTFDQGHLCRTMENPLGGSQDNPRVKLDLNMWQDSKPYVGVRIIIPVGD